MYSLPECSDNELDLLVNNCTEERGVFTENISQTLQILVENIEQIGEEKFKFSNGFLIAKDYRQFPTNEYHRKHAPVFKFWKYKENKDIRWLSIPNPLYYYTFMYNILKVKPLLIKMYDFFDEKIEMENIKVISRFICAEEFSYANPYTSKNDVFLENSLIKNEGSFEKHKAQDVSLRSSSLYQTKVDIQDYYNSIYVHEITRLSQRKMFEEFLEELSISEQKEFEKFLHEFEQFNMNLNNRQTNGIITGPFSSYITGELILLAIDYELNCFLKEKINHNGNSKLKYSRFVDDYSIYSDDESLIELFIKELDLILEKYSLKLNRQKIERLTPGIYDRTPNNVKKQYEDIFLQILEQSSDYTRVLLEIEYVLDEIIKTYPIKSINGIITSSYMKFKSSESSNLFKDDEGDFSEESITNFIQMMINKSILHPQFGKKILIFTLYVVEELKDSNYVFENNTELTKFFQTRTEIFDNKLKGSENQYYFLKIEELIYPDETKIISENGGSFVRENIIVKDISLIDWNDINIKIESLI